MSAVLDAPAAVHPSAQPTSQQPAPLPALAVANGYWRMSGVITQDAEVRATLQGHDGSGGLLVCFEVMVDNQFKTRLTTHQVHASTAYKAAHATAHALKRGVHVTVDVPMHQLHLVAHDTAHVYITPAPPKPKAPAAGEASNPSLFT